jgi:uncharacterized membrane protein
VSWESSPFRAKRMSMIGLVMPSAFLGIETRRYRTFDV